MRKLSFLIIVVFCLVSCEKNGLVPDNEIPIWLKERIAHDEAIIKESPHLWYNYGAWMRYEFEDDFYFEYENPLSSTAYPIYSESEVHISLVSSHEEYLVSLLKKYVDNRCCKKFVWKAPNYHDYSED